MTRRWPVLVGVVGAVVVLWGAPAALASTVVHAVPAPRAAKVRDSIAAGYEVKVTASSVSYSGEVKVPSVTCAAASTGKLLIGQFIAITIGTNPDGEAGLAIGIHCSGTTAVYSTAILINGTSTVLSSPVKAGNTVAFTATVSSSGATAKVTDLSTKKSVSASGGGGTPRGVAITTGSLLTKNWPKFKKVKFSHLTISGKAIGESHPVRINQGVRVGKHKVVIQIRASVLSAAGTSFSDVYVTNATQPDHPWSTPSSGLASADAAFQLAT